MAWTEITRPKYRRDGLRYASDTTDASGSRAKCTYRAVTDHMPSALVGASTADITASDGNAPVITATTSLITVVFGLTMAARRPNR